MVVREEELSFIYNYWKGDLLYCYCYETDVSSFCMSWLVRGKKHLPCSNVCAEDSIGVVVGVTLIVDH